MDRSLRTGEADSGMRTLHRRNATLDTASPAQVEVTLRTLAPLMQSDTELPEILSQPSANLLAYATKQLLHAMEQPNQG